MRDCEGVLVARNEVSTVVNTSMSAGALKMQSHTPLLSWIAKAGPVSHRRFTSVRDESLGQGHDLFRPAERAWAMEAS